MDDDQGFCCVECGEFCNEEEWNDNDICDFCKTDKTKASKFINERGLKESFKEWQQENK